MNLASRIETANKEIGTNFLISEETYVQVKEQIHVKQCVRLALRGKRGEYSLYEVAGLRTQNS